MGLRIVIQYTSGAPRPTQIWSEVQRDYVSEVLAAFLQDVMVAAPFKAAKNDGEAIDRDVYVVILDYDTASDTVRVSADTGSYSLAVGLVMNALKTIDDPGVYQEGPAPDLATGRIIYAPVAMIGPWQDVEAARGGGRERRWHPRIPGETGHRAAYVRSKNGQWYGTTYYSSADIARHLPPASSPEAAEHACDFDLWQRGWVNSRRAAVGPEAAIRAELAEIDDALRLVSELVEAVHTEVDRDRHVHMTVDAVLDDATAGRDRIRAATERLRVLVEGSVNRDASRGTGG